MNTWKEGDVFSWAWNEKMLSRLSHGNNGGTTYWCKSQIGVVKDDGLLYDTYWIGNNNTNWTPECAESELELVYKGNLNDYRKAEPYERACYKDEDCMELSHANSRTGNFYIRKDAQHCMDKKRSIILRNKVRLEDKIKYELSQIRRYQDMLDDKSYENMLSLPIENDINLWDTCWYDNPEENI